MPATTKPVFVVERVSPRDPLDVRKNGPTGAHPGKQLPAPFSRLPCSAETILQILVVKKEKKNVPSSSSERAIILSFILNVKSHSCGTNIEEDQPLRLGGSQETTQALTIEVSRAFVRIQELLPIAAAQRTFYRPPVTSISGRRDPLTRWSFPSVLVSIAV